MTRRIRRYVFTCNNYTQLPDAINSNIRYLLFAEEICPTTSTPHIQGYIEFYKQEYFNTIVSLIKTAFGNHAHIEPAKADVNAQIAYISKQNKPIEFGKPACPGTRNDLIAIKKSLDEGSSVDDIADINFGVYLRYYKGMDRYVLSKTVPKQVRKLHEKTLTILLTGPSRTGKTTWAYENYPEITSVEYDGKFYSDSPHYALFDDISPDTFGRKEFLTLTDHGQKKVRMLGAYTNWNPKVIVLTSNYSLEELFTDDAMMNRIDKHIPFPLTKRAPGK